jgi:hypothetical protein
VKQMITRANLTQEICSHVYGACRRARSAHPEMGPLLNYTFESVDWDLAVVLAAARLSVGKE